MNNATSDQDRRIARTREAIFGAFLRLVFDRRYDGIRTADLVREAGIGRSTFYEHFRDKDEVLIAAIEPILLPLANAASGRASAAMVRTMLEHVWDRRALGRIILDSAAAPKLRQRLAAMIEARMAIEGYGPAPLALPAMVAATGQLVMLRMWVAGEVSCPVDDLARHLMAFANLAARDERASPGSAAASASPARH
jgi:AcrR family transcriptional regulator